MFEGGGGGGGGGGWGGGYSDIFIHFNIFGVFRKNKNIFFGVGKFCGYFFGVITKFDYI